MSVQAKSGSELLLGVRSEPKTRLSLSVTLCPLSSTICVNRTETAKWFKPFVRGTFETETSLNPVLALSLVDSQSYSGANCAPNNHSENGFKTQHISVLYP